MELKDCIKNPNFIDHMDIDLFYNLNQLGKAHFNIDISCQKRRESIENKL